MVQRLDGVGVVDQRRCAAELAGLFMQVAATVADLLPLLALLANLLGELPEFLECLGGDLGRVAQGRDFAMQLAGLLPLFAEFRAEGDLGDERREPFLALFQFADPRLQLPLLLHQAKPARRVGRLGVPGTAGRVEAIEERVQRLRIATAQACLAGFLQLLGDLRDRNAVGPGG